MLYLQIQRCLLLLGMLPSSGAWDLVWPTKLRSHTSGLWEKGERECQIHDVPTRYWCYYGFLLMKVPAHYLGCSKQAHHRAWRNYFFLCMFQLNKTFILRFTGVTGFKLYSDFYFFFLSGQRTERRGQVSSELLSKYLSYHFRNANGST